MQKFFDDSVKSIQKRQHLAYKYKGICVYIFDQSARNYLVFHFSYKKHSLLIDYELIMLVNNMQQHSNYQALSWHAFTRAINLYATNSFKKPDLASSMILIEHHRKSSTFLILDLLLTQTTNLEMKKKCYLAKWFIF